VEEAAARIASLPDETVKSIVGRLPDAFMPADQKQMLAEHLVWRKQNLVASIGHCYPMWVMSIRTYRYTVCVYYPNLYRSDEFFTFAVLVTPTGELFLIGTNLDVYKMRVQNAIEKIVVQGSIEALERMLDNVIEETDCRSEYQVLEEIVSNNQASVQLWPFQEASGDSIHEMGHRVFFQQVLRRITRQPIGRKWRATPRIDTMELALA
jgi:hypothetical protein